MIHAKPLKTKGLGRPAHPPTPTNIQPDENRVTTALEPSENRLVTVTEVITKQNKIRPSNTKVIKTLVKLEPGLKSTQIEWLVNEFYKREGFKGIPYSSAATYLKMLVDQGALTRIRVNGVWRYYERVG